MHWRVFFALLTFLSPLSTNAQAGDCLAAQCSSFDQLNKAVVSLLQHPDIITSGQKAVLSRAGDSTAIAILKDVPDTDLRTDKTVRQVLFALRLSFSSPELIQECSDRRPTFAMLLIGHIVSLNPQSSVLSEIEETKALIQRNTREP